MGASFYFYDLETSGINPRKDRVMQFAGQRTDMDLNPIGEPHNFLIKLSEDTLPSPEAIMVTGITPQQTLLDGLTEAEFLKIFHKEISAPETIFVGFNTVRFDDEFMRYMHYRNFYDPYEWQWRDKRSRWDLLDLARMTRALRPEGIKWPKDGDGKSVNRLELIAEANGLMHESAHDALSDVLATIELAKLFKKKQPKLYNYLLKMRSKKQVAEVVSSGQPFVYSSGKYDHEYEKTAVVGPLSAHPGGQGAVVFDLRYNPKDFVDMSPSELAESMKFGAKEDGKKRFPAKTIKFNRCPAIAPLGVLDESSQKRLEIDLKQSLRNFRALQEVQDQLAKGFEEAVAILDKEREKSQANEEKEVDERMYDGFLESGDKNKMNMVRSLDVNGLADFSEEFSDERLNQLLPLYKARNYPKSLTDSERVVWESFKERKLLEGGSSSEIAQFAKKLRQLDEDGSLPEEKKFLLQELQLYAESILPASY